MGRNAIRFNSSYIEKSNLLDLQIARKIKKSLLKET